jgi:hypothetical protein
VQHLDLEKDNLFLHFDAQAKPANEVTFQPGEVVFCDAWTVHRAAVPKVDTVRTFLRLSFSVRQFDRLSNSQNPLLPLGCEYVSRDIPKSLRGPEGP